MTKAGNNLEKDIATGTTVTSTVQGVRQRGKTTTTFLDESSHWLDGNVGWRDLEGRPRSQTMDGNGLPRLQSSQHRIILLADGLADTVLIHKGQKLKRYPYATTCHSHLSWHLFDFGQQQNVVEQKEMHLERLWYLYLTHNNLQLWLSLIIYDIIYIVVQTLGWRNSQLLVHESETLPTLLSLLPSVARRLRTFQRTLTLKIY